MDEQQYPKQALDKFRQWHFWWLVVFSLFLIVTFIYYLPTRFLNQVAMDDHHMEDMDEHMDENMDEHMNGMNDQGQMMDHGDHDDVGHGTTLYHEEADIKEGLVVNLNISPVPFVAGSPLNLDFRVNIKPGNVPVQVSGLQIEHEKLMHVIGVRSDLNEFFHIHPAPDVVNEGLLSVGHIFNKSGLYKIWSEIKKDDAIHVFGHPEVSVGGQGAREEKNVSFARNVMVKGYQISLQEDKVLTKNKENKLYFDIHDSSGREINVENYLGAQMHLTIIKDDLKQIIHTHPESGDHSHSFKIAPDALAHGDVEDGHNQASEDEIITFNVNLPEAGLYKAFAQFRPENINLLEDEALLAEFWLQVEERASSVISPWWGLLMVSIVLIIILSLVVNKYITVNSEQRP